jgi:long-subunit acyl-CoA synthetase (AMP-forming)
MAVRDETGKILGPGENGELWFKSRHTCIGYLNNPKESERSFQNGWIRTGDLGYYDKDGLVYVLERMKEIFHYFGNQVS